MIELGGSVMFVQSVLSGARSKVDHSLNLIGGVLMYVYYYQYGGVTKLICTNGAYPSSRSLIWKCNTSVWLVPGTEK